MECHNPLKFELSRFGGLIKFASVKMQNIKAGRKTTSKTFMRLSRDWKFPDLIAIQYILIKHGFQYPVFVKKGIFSTLYWATVKSSFHPKHYNLVKIFILPKTVLFLSKQTSGNTLNRPLFVFDWISLPKYWSLLQFVRDKLLFALLHRAKGGNLLSQLYATSKL